MKKKMSARKLLLPTNMMPPICTSMLNKCKSMLPSLKLSSLNMGLNSCGASSLHTDSFRGTLPLSPQKILRASAASSSSVQQHTPSALHLHQEHEHDDAEAPELPPTTSTSIATITTTSSFTPSINSTTVKPFIHHPPLHTTPQHYPFQPSPHETSPYNYTPNPFPKSFTFKSFNTNSDINAASTLQYSPNPHCDENINASHAPHDTPDLHAFEHHLMSSEAIPKYSLDPCSDFALSILDMVLAHNLTHAADLEHLYHCYLQLNAPKHHSTITIAFLTSMLALRLL